MIMNLYRNIDRHQVQFDFVVHTPDECAYDQEIESLGGRIYRAPRYRGTNHLAYINWWYDFLESHNCYTIVHGHVRSTAAIYLGIASKFGLTTIAHSHSTSSGSGPAAIIKTAYQLPISRTADYLFACSSAAGIWLYGQRATTKPNYFTLPNAIDLDDFRYSDDRRNQARTELGIQDRFVVGHVGRFEEPKNHDFLFEVFQQIHKINNTAILLLVGEGRLRPVIERRAAISGLLKDVIFTGARSDVSDLFHAMDVFILPSRFEGLPVSLVEAQATGLHCVVSDRVTKDAKLTDLVQFLSLTDSAEQWAKAAQTCAPAFTRRDRSREIRQSGYDASKNASWLQSFYIHCADKSECGE